MKNQKYKELENDKPHSKEPILKRLGLSKTSILHWCRVILILAVLVFLLLVWIQAKPKSYWFVIELLLWFTNENLYTKLLPYHLQIRLDSGSIILLALEFFIIAFCIWKLIFRSAWIALIRLRSLFMLVLSSYWLWILLYGIIGIEHLDIWDKYLTFYNNNLLIGFTFFYPVWNEILMIKVLPIIWIYCGLYVITKLTLKAGTQGRKLSKEGLEAYSLLEVCNKARRGKWLFFSKPSIYISSQIYDNAYCSGNVMVISADIMENADETIRQAILLHELGHFYHHDCEVDFICDVCICAFTLPLNILLIVSKYLFVIFRYIPFLNLSISILCFVSTVCLSVLTLVAGFLNKLFYLFDGRFAERRADLFAVDIGYGIGLYKYLLNEYSVSLWDILTDTHPKNKTRRKYIKQRIIDNWGESYWKQLVAEHNLGKYE